MYIYIDYIKHWLLLLFLLQCPQNLIWIINFFDNMRKVIIFLSRNMCMYKKNLSHNFLRFIDWWILSMDLNLITQSSTGWIRMNPFESYPWLQWSPVALPRSLSLTLYVLTSLSLNAISYPILRLFISGLQLLEPCHLLQQKAEKPGSTLTDYRMRTHIHCPRCRWTLTYTLLCPPWLLHLSCPTFLISLPVYIDTFPS